MKCTLPKSTDMEPIALVGVGCHFPGGISDTKSFWELLVNKEDGINRSSSGSIGWRLSQ
jgi:acyl transferase domain-containing protein